MKVDMVLKVRDVPGMLVAALDPISRHGGNIISVTHSRAKKDHVSVYVGFIVKDQSALDLIRKTLEEEKVQVSSLEVDGRNYYLKKSLSFILVGHVIDCDLQDTVDRINGIGLVSNLDVVMPSPEKKSTVMMHVDVDDKDYGELVSLVEGLCREKEFLMIKSL